jgi:hypothetical protein
MTVKTNKTVGWAVLWGVDWAVRGAVDRLVDDAVAVAVDLAVHWAVKRAQWQTLDDGTHPSGLQDFLFEVGVEV